MNLERIPSRRTFVKCKNCGTPIFIDPPHDETGASATVSEPSSGVSTAGARRAQISPGQQTIVGCPQCGTRYHLPPKVLERPGAKLKCGRCGHLFTPSTEESAVRPAPAEPAEAGTHGPEIYPAPGVAGEIPPEEPSERSFPVPDQSTMDGMFEDVREQSPPFPPPQTTPEPAPISSEVPEIPSPAEPQIFEKKTAARAPQSEQFDPERAYLEAISFEDGDVPRSTRHRGTVPMPHKERFFLKPRPVGDALRSGVQSGVRSGIEKAGADADSAPIAPGQPPAVPPPAELPPAEPSPAEAEAQAAPPMARGEETTNELMLEAAGADSMAGDDTDAELDALLADEDFAPEPPPDTEPEPTVLDLAGPDPEVPGPAVPPPPVASASDTGTLDLDQLADSLHQSTEEAPDLVADSAVLADGQLNDVALTGLDWDNRSNVKWGQADAAAGLRAPTLGRLLPWFLILVILLTFAIVFTVGHVSPTPQSTVQAPPETQAAGVPALSSLPQISRTVRA
ncbi:MAG: zinc-ribbon domain-containing protein [SAR324 cluster bacterium]|nr:zinc-ribbon domain-containing protein [SAR324 cluster bacterium]